MELVRQVKKCLKISKLLYVEVDFIMEKSKKIITFLNYIYPVQYTINI